MTGRLFSGDIKFDRKTEAWASQGFSDPINVTSLQISPGETDDINRVSRKNDTYGQNLDSVQLPSSGSTVTIVFDDVDPEQLALALLGDVPTAAVVAGDSVTDESITAIHDKWVSLANRNVDTGTVVVTSDPAGTTYVLGTDCELDLFNGQVKVLSTGAIADSAALLVSYDYGARTSTAVKQGQVTSIRLGLVGHMIDKASGSEGQLTLPRCNVTPSEAIDFMSAEFISVTLSGPIITPDGSDTGFTFEEDA